MSQVGRRILERMLDRLFAAIVSGPSLNCRPHNSRQRVDLTQLARFKDAEPSEVLRLILSDGAAAKLSARVSAPARIGVRDRAAGSEAGEGIPAEETPEQAAARRAWADQLSLLSKLRTLVDEARTYEEDTGVWALNIGFPLLSLPPGTAPGRASGTRRVLAPIALIPVSVTVRTGSGAGVEIACRCEEADRVAPNEALLSWLEQQTGHGRDELFADEEGTRPWREIGELVRHVANLVSVEVPDVFAGDDLPERIPLIAAPKSEEMEGGPQILASAVVGLFPVSNQGLLRDTREMIEGGAPPGPIESFLRSDATLATATEPGATEAPPPAGERRASEERLIAAADPCQARAVALAQTSRGLVIHGPPGTGKSQTITNIIGDHLARGERVLFVCDKRTALDVVASRLEHLGLGDLCALVHDPQRDQRDLYRSIREQLERLADAKTNPKAEAEVGKIDSEIDAIFVELRAAYQGLMRERPDGLALHELVGRWLALADVGTAAVEPGGDVRREPALSDSGPATSFQGATLAELDSAEPAIREILTRAVDAAYATNPWGSASGLKVEDLVSRPMDHFRSALDRCARAAATADATMHESIPAFAAAAPLEEQAAARERLLALLEKALVADANIRALWAARNTDAVQRGRRLLGEAAAPFEAMNNGFDAELWAVVRDDPPAVPEIARRLGVLGAYLRTARAWWGPLAFAQRSAAGKVLLPLGLSTSVESAERAKRFYDWLRAVRVVAGVSQQLSGTSPGPLPDADALQATMRDHAAVIHVMLAVADGTSLVGLRERVVRALADGPGSASAATLGEGLRRSGPRAKALRDLEGQVKSASLFASQWQGESAAEWRSGAAAGPRFQTLQESLPTLEDVLRVGEGLAMLPPALAPGVAALVKGSAEPESGLRKIRRGVTEAEVLRRLDREPKLRAIDARRMRTLFTRHAELEERKRLRVRDAIMHRWVSRQRERLLAATGSRLNSEGAEVKRRLAIRGRRAMRLRQVVAMGRNAEAGDPLLDLRPVWMASPETVAQVLPREAIFGVVIFDEASQCRLEEALPALTRAARVVIAGDPKQLPPTRFFESSVASSDGDEIASDQDLFEAQQGEVEDLLGAALGLDVEQSYLDVHYRSRNSDLIAFSNDSFYGSRLQPIPGHPRNRARFAPVSLYQARGGYEKRTNRAEAEQVCRIIRDLLKRAEPPSIGVGCFNLPQRDLIVEMLDDMAAAEPQFAAALGAARERRGAASSEHLFVKNLENVQGDERDHIIISTTYGPDAQGRFYRRFGPLGQPGGGRRLNVLVTRAREEVHIVTSIPPEVYRALPPVPAGQAPGGGWLLFAYLKFAEDLGARYEHIREALDAGRGADGGGGEDQPPRVSPAEEVILRPTAAPSVLADAIGRRISREARLGSIVHWGNDGFCVDVAVRHPQRPEDVTLGVLCDLTRFPLAADPVEWDLFRTAVLEGQGWDLLRIWSPTIFRDTSGTVRQILDRAAAAAGRDDDPDAIPVHP